MTKAISSYPERERSAVVARRLKGKTGGLGYWAAKDYVARKGEEVVKETKAKAEDEQADRINGEA